MTEHAGKAPRHKGTPHKGTPHKGAPHKGAPQAEGHSREAARPSGLSGPHGDLMALQDAAGNHAVGEWLRPGAMAAPPAPDGLPPLVQSVLNSGGGRPLDPATRDYMESRFGEDFGQVRVHTDAQAAESAQAVSARAYVVGKNIVFNTGRYTPETSAGRRLLAHELVHVVQQTPKSGEQVSHSHAETEAVQTGGQAASGQAVQVHSNTAGGIQRTPLTPEEEETIRIDAKLARMEISSDESNRLEERRKELEATQAQHNFDEELRQKLSLHGVTFKPPTPTPKAIPPRKKGEITQDIVVDIEGKKTTLAKANVEGERALIVRNLTAELARTKDVCLNSEQAAQEFQKLWLRGLADVFAGSAPPSPAIWGDVHKAITEARAALKDGNLEKAREQTALAEKRLRNAQATWGRYVVANIGGAEDIKRGAEHVKQGAQYSLMALAIAASGGAAAGTAAAIAAGGHLAIEATDVAANYAIGDPIDWTQVVVGLAVNLVLGKFGKQLTGGLISGLQKLVPKGTKPAIISGAVGLFDGSMRTALHTIVAEVVGMARKQDESITWQAIIDRVIANVFAKEAIVQTLLFAVVGGKAKGRPPQPAKSRAASGSVAKKPSKSEKSGQATPAKAVTAPRHAPPLSAGKGAAPAKQAPKPTSPPASTSKSVPKADAKATAPKHTPPSPIKGAAPAKQAHKPTTPQSKAAQPTPKPIVPPKAPTKPKKDRAKKSVTDTARRSTPPSSELTKIDLARMNKKQRHRWVNQNFSEAKSTEWTKSHDTRTLNGEGVLVIKYEPGMIADDARRKAAALNDLAKRSQMKTPEAGEKLPARKKDRALFGDTTQHVPLSTLERHKLIDQVHKQAARQGWSEQRKNAVIARILRMEGDHVHDFQLGGGDKNIWALDAYTNERLGAQVRAQLRNVPPGTKITEVRFEAEQKRVRIATGDNRQGEQQPAAQTERKRVRIPTEDDTELENQQAEVEAQKRQQKRRRHEE